jgi:UDP-glucose 4-epimerase
MKKYTIIIAVSFYSHFLFTIPSFDFAQKYKNISVLITGGCGFIGSHLVERLVVLGAHVSVLDDLSSGNKINIAAVEDKITFIHGSITDFDTCLYATKNKEIIFHLAAFVSVPQSMQDPVLCHETNVTGTYNILEAARINNVRRVVFSSSCAVYGDSELLCRETNAPSPISPYGFSKLLGELCCAEYARVYDIETVAMRYFNVYGPRQNPHGSYAGVIAKFSYNMERNLPIAIFGDGMQMRDFVPVKDVVVANIVLGLCDKKMIQGEVFNIATGKSINLLELIDRLKETYKNYHGDIIFMPERPGDVKSVFADCSKYNRLYNAMA